MTREFQRSLDDSSKEPASQLTEFWLDGLSVCSWFDLWKTLAYHFMTAGKVAAACMHDPVYWVYWRRSSCMHELSLKFRFQNCHACRATNSETHCLPDAADVLWTAVPNRLCSLHWIEIYLDWGVCLRLSLICWTNQPICCKVSCRHAALIEMKCRVGSDFTALLRTL